MNQINTYRIRLLIAAGIITVGFLVLFVRLYQEQIYSGDRYQRKISRQSVRRVRLPGLRGRIFTSDYLLLADNAPTYNLVFYLQEMRRNSRRRTIENIRKAAVFMAKGLERPDTLTEKNTLGAPRLRHAALHGSRLQKKACRTRKLHRGFYRGNGRTQDH